MTNFISRIFGRFAKHEFSPLLQEFINGAYARIFNINLSEFESIKNYKSLSALFTRKLKKMRTFDAKKSVIIAPSDSVITEFGSTDSGTDSNVALQIKGMAYSVDELLNGDAKNRLGEEKLPPMNYANFYLSPKDYHRFHAPIDFEITSISYFSGALLPVNLPSLNKNKDLFVRNERVVISGIFNKKQRLFFVAVGALNVGQIIIHAESKISTNAKMGSALYTYKMPIKIAKGEELGMFNMGSTIVLFMENAKFNLARNQAVKFGESIGNLE